MSDANLPDSLDGPNMHNAQTRQHNWPTITTNSQMTPAHRVLLDKVDSIQATIDFIRITGGPFTGKTYRPDGRSCTSFTKFLINFRYVIFRAIAGLPAAMDAVSLTEAIFYELRPREIGRAHV